MGGPAGSQVVSFWLLSVPGLGPGASSEEKVGPWFLVTC